jgi:hypothetical protein
MVIRTGLILILLSNGVCQVAVQLKTSKPAYLVGEPIFVIVDVTNIGTEAVGYSSCDGEMDLTVVHTEKKQRPNLEGCGIGIGGFGGCFIDHPPLLHLQEHTSFQYLLKDYRLAAGDYLLHAKGKAGVRWKYYPDMRLNAPKSPPPQYQGGEPVAGAAFEVSLPIQLTIATPEELKAAYAPYLSDAEGPGAGMAEMHQAREAIAEMAPEFLEKHIAGFATSPVRTPELAVAGLSQIPTDESRADLIKLYDNSTDLLLRRQIVEALAGIATHDQVSFFAQLLPGRSTPSDDQIREWATLGLGHIGGDVAVRALAQAPMTQNPQIRRDIVVALGNTKSRAAIPPLIQMYHDDALKNDVCGALRELTHYTWCDGSGDNGKLQSRWRQWWNTHGSKVNLYGNDQCSDWSTTLPQVQ